MSNPFKAFKWAALGAILSSQRARRAIVSVFIILFAFAVIRTCASAVSNVSDAVETKAVDSTRAVVTAQIPDSYEKPKPVVRAPPKRKLRKENRSSAKGDLEFKQAVSFTLDLIEKNQRARLSGSLPSDVVEKLDLNNPLVAEALDVYIKNYLIYLARVSKIDWAAVDTLDKAEENEFIIIKLKE